MLVVIAATVVSVAPVVDNGGGVGFVEGDGAVGLVVISVILVVVSATVVVIMSVIDNESLMLDDSRQHIKYPDTSELLVPDAPHGGSSLTISVYVLQGTPSCNPT